MEINVESIDDVGIKDAILICQKCKEHFHIYDGIFYLRKIEKHEGDKRGTWNLENFDERYDSLPIYKNGLEWPYITGIPKEVMGFMYPKVKGRILDWIEPRENDLIIDVGCGGRLFSFRHTKNKPLC